MVASRIACSLLLLVDVAMSPTVSFAASDLPDKTVRIIVPNAAAGPNDLVGRMIGPQLSQTIGQSVIVDNRPSANGVIGSEYVARAAPDGSVLAVGNSGTHAVNYTLYKNPSYDPVREFAAITEVIFSSLVLVANPSVKANSVKELITEAKAMPNKLNIAIAGATGELAGDMIKLMGKADINNVPYKGGAPAVIAVMSNESQLLLTLYSNLSAQIESGKLKALGTTGSRRIPQLPNVPTIAESGLPGYEFEFWVGVFAPAKTPSATVHALSREIVRIINLPNVKKRFVETGYEVVGSTPEQFSERVRHDTERFRKIILDSKMQQLD